MPVKNVAIELPSDFEPLPDDIYQVAITDVNAFEGKKYKSEETQVQLRFSCKVVDKGEYKDNPITIFSTIKWFAGRGNLSPSKLFSVVKAVYDYYDKKADLTKLELTDLNDSFLNDLIGKQLRITVQITQNNRNKVTAFMPIKKEVKYKVEKPEPTDEPDKEELDEDVDPDEVPF